MDLIHINSGHNFHPNAMAFCCFLNRYNAKIFELLLFKDLVAILSALLKIPVVPTDKVGLSVVFVDVHCQNARDHMTRPLITSFVINSLSLVILLTQYFADAKLRGSGRLQNENCAFGLLLKARSEQSEVVEVHYQS